MTRMKIPIFFCFPDPRYPRNPRSFSSEIALDADPQSMVKLARIFSASELFE